ncbi:hypothetical protein CR513_14889, partial [Mucuna pruriens]
MNALTNFWTNTSFQSLYEAWERFEEVHRKCPHLDFSRVKLIEIFYNDLSILNQTSIDSTCGMTIMKKSSGKAYEIMEDMACNNYHYSSRDKHVTNRPIEVYQRLSSCRLLLLHVSNVGQQAMRERIAR